MSSRERGGKRGPIDHRPTDLSYFHFEEAIPSDLRNKIERTQQRYTVLHQRPKRPRELRVIPMPNDASVSRTSSPQLAGSVVGRVSDG